MKTKLPRPATFPAVHRLTYSECYGYNFFLDPGAALPAPGSDPKTWSAFPVATVVRLAPYDPTAATTGQRDEHAIWAEDDDLLEPGDPATSYWFCALRNGDTGEYEVGVLPGYLCGLDH